MNSDTKKLQVFLLFAALSISGGFAQKVKVGYDKAADFSKYKTFTLEEPTTKPSRPLLYASVMGTIKDDLQAKGLVSVEKDGDLKVIPNGGLGYDLGSAPEAASCPNCKAPAMDAQWPSYMAPAGGGGKGLPQGTLELTMIDGAGNNVVWDGRVTQKLNADKKDESLQKIYAAIHKLLDGYPPKK